MKITLPLGLVAKRTFVMNKGRPKWWNEAVKFLEKDDLLGPIVKTYPGEGLSGKGDIFESVIRSIVGQQISVKASQAIWIRFTEKVGGKVTAENILKFTPDELATCGLTRPKSRYIHGIASQYDDFMLDDWSKPSDEEIVKHLVKFKGIGTWTAEMVMMFSLMRPDVFSIKDLGLVKVKLLVLTYLH